MSNGKTIDGEYVLSQVDPFNENHFYIEVEFEQGKLTWFQEHPNQLYYTDTRETENKTYVIERNSAPSLSGRPGGHSKGYGDFILDETTKLFIPRRTGLDSDDNSLQNMLWARDAVEKVAQWNASQMIYDKDSSGIVDPGMEYHTWIVKNQPLKAAPANMKVVGK